jgi:hypothetical protein
MSEEEKKRGRPSMNTKSYHVKIEGDLAEILDTQSNKNRYVNESLRAKMERDGLIKCSKRAKKSD